MKRREVIAQRAHGVFGDRLDQVLQAVQHDRQELHGWQEPAHLRAVLRRAVREGAAMDKQAAPVDVVETEIGRGAGEPEKGQQRESLGQILEAGAAALAKTLAGPAPDLTPDETFGLECVILLYGRPALLVNQGRLAAPSSPICTSEPSKVERKRPAKWRKAMACRPHQALWCANCQDYREKQQ